MTEKKLCPFRMINESLRYRQNCECVEDQCAWWDEDEILNRKFPKCAILAAALRLK